MLSPREYNKTLRAMLKLGALDKAHHAELYDEGSSDGDLYSDSGSACEYDSETPDDDDDEDEVDDEDDDERREDVFLRNLTHEMLHALDDARGVDHGRQLDPVALLDVRAVVGAQGAEALVEHL